MSACNPEDRPKTPEELILLVEIAMKAPRKYGVYLTKPEMRCLRRMHILHAALAKPPAGPGTAPVE